MVFLESLLIFIWTMFIKWDTEKIIAIMTALGTYILLFGFAEWLLMNPLRIAGPLSAATCYAVVLVLIWSILFAENCFSRRFPHLIMLLITLFVFIAVLISGTRMGIIGIVMGTLLGVIFSAWVSKLRDNTFFQKILYSTFILVCISSLIFAIWTLIPNEIYVKRALDSVIAGKIDISNMGRIISWIVALDVVKENQIWGIGPGNFSGVYKLFLQSLENNRMIQQMNHSHNIYLMILSEYGFSGFFIFALIVIACFMQLFFRLKNSNSAGIYYALLSCGIITVTLGMVDIIPFDWYSIGLVAWYMGVLASFSLTKNRETAK
jgi:O-antigen ligase